MKEMTQILAEIQEVISLVKEEQVVAVNKRIQKEKRIFILGEGRSGLQGKGFAMRLMHLGYQVYVIGETITPSIQSGDLLIAISGSGTTGNIVQLVEGAKKKGIEIIGITSEPASPLAQSAEQLLIIPGATKTGSGIHSIQLLSSLFDQTLHITLDYVCLMISKRDNVSNEDAKKQHSNME
ncbi:6-phospho-3-hexuloisomerase [Enterococcus sp. BWR-S5]|uniref:6-phospho-3-hexuloisomerase n=1 Tax=Enterococcus sp. BWR-S5 TaxID=2787714 RepID=UPI0019241C54|nr:6-phospho-3-hexuloisomerase [Enterococcus sp. BWR-S5]MBL1226029.1 6-phospho-3-hexuloisomerase [Enterococcus sp. BWR-S5]